MQVNNNYIKYKSKRWFNEGHGVDNCKIEYETKDGDEGDGINKTGDCLVQCDGNLFSVDDLKSILLSNSHAKIISILDCCRDEMRNASTHHVIRLK